MIPIVIGTTVLLGWSARLHLLTQLFAPRSAMQPVTAACAVISGTGVLAAARGKAEWLVRATAGLIIAVALQTLVEQIWKVDLGTDRLLFPAAVDAQPVPYVHPGRMAAPTAVAFLLIGIAILLTGRSGRGAGRSLSAAATAVLFLAMTAFLGQLYAVQPFDGLLSFTQVALPTAASLAGLSAGVLSLRPQGSWVSLLVGDTIGAAAARWLLPLVVIVPVLVASLALHGSEVGLYPADFRLALTTAVTIALLGALALWGSLQLDRRMRVHQAAELLREEKATLRAFFETEGLFAAILERQGTTIRYLAANQALANLHGREIDGLEVSSVEDGGAAAELLARLQRVEATGSSLRMEQRIETASGERWFAVTISQISGYPPDAPRFTTASLEITERKRAEAQQRLLLDELNHRVKNTLAVVQSLAQQSFRGDLADPAAKKGFESRLAAVAAAHSLLVRQEWKTAPVRALVADVAGPGCGADRDRFDIDGPDVELPPKTAVSVALALHELCTNAVKYGALSNDHGRIAVRWSLEAVEQPLLRLSWAERGGPPVTVPSSRGFGSRLIERALSAELGRPVAMEFRPEGLVCVIEARLAPEPVETGHQPLPQ